MSFGLSIYNLALVEFIALSSVLSITINIIITNALTSTILLHASPCASTSAWWCRFRHEDTIRAAILSNSSSASTLTQKAHYRRTNDVFKIPNDAYTNARLREIMIDVRLEDATSLA